jgi:hypothetical protein
MKIKATWSKTGHELFFDSINADLAHWFVSTSQKLGNRYSIGDMPIDLLRNLNDTDQLIKEEIDFVTAVNDQLRKSRMPTFTLPENWYDQKHLNQLHKSWSRTRQVWPKLTELLYKIDKKLFEAYQEMNCHIHLIEESFEYRLRDSSNWRVENPFQQEFFSWEVSHLYLRYPGHGRYAFEKFKNLDEDEDIGIDNVNWSNIDGYIGIKLIRPYKSNPPTEFLSWCQEKNLVPHGDTLPLANLSNWQTELTKSRQIMTENVKIQGNYLSLELID